MRNTDEVKPVLVFRLLVSSDCTLLRCPGKNLTAAHLEAVFPRLKFPAFQRIYQWLFCQCSLCEGRVHEVFHQ